MARCISSFILVILTSFFLFPFEFTFMPGINTKMVLAAFGLCMFGINLITGRRQQIKRNHIEIVVLSAIVSLVAVISAVYNNTYDLTYGDYIVSMLVWTFGAYAVVEIIRLYHGCVTMELAGKYLIAVCVFQCVMALIIDNSPVVDGLVNRYVAGMGFVDMAKLNGEGRLYGIGCSLDVAGTRFAAILVLIAQLLLGTDKKTYERLLYIVAFFIIVIVGDMISRTTILGAALAIVLLLIQREQSGKRTTLSLFLTTGAIFALISVALYNTNPVFHDNIRFAFEGFFSLVEKGHWETNSNNILQNMIVFPDSVKTWFIGDGYLVNPYDNNPYYVGQNYGGFYKDTDIGYLRFIFYFGIIGLLLFSYYFVAVCRQLISKFPRYKLMFLLILSLNFLIWFKVSTDIYLIFAFFLCIPKEDKSISQLKETHLPDQLTL